MSSVGCEEVYLRELILVIARCYVETVAHSDATGSFSDWLACWKAVHIKNSGASKINVVKCMKLHWVDFILRLRHQATKSDRWHWAELPPAVRRFCLFPLRYPIELFTLHCLGVFLNVSDTLRGKSILFSPCPVGPRSWGHTHSLSLSISKELVQSWPRPNQQTKSRLSALAVRRATLKVFMPSKYILKPRVIPSNVRLVTNPLMP